MPGAKIAWGEAKNERKSPADNDIKILLKKLDDMLTPSVFKLFSQKPFSEDVVKLIDKIIGKGGKKLLLEHEANQPNRSFLVKAIIGEHPSVVQKLIDEGSDILPALNPAITSLEKISGSRNKFNTLCVRQQILCMLLANAHLLENLDYAHLNKLRLLLDKTSHYLPGHVDRDKISDFFLRRMQKAESQFYKGLLLKKEAEKIEGANFQKLFSSAIRCFRTAAYNNYGKFENGAVAHAEWLYTIAQYAQHYHLSDEAIIKLLESKNFSRANKILPHDTVENRVDCGWSYLNHLWGIEINRSEAFAKLDLIARLIPPALAKTRDSKLERLARHMERKLEQIQGLMRQHREEKLEDKPERREGEAQVERKPDEEQQIEGQPNRPLEHKHTK